MLYFEKNSRSTKFRKNAVEQVPEKCPLISDVNFNVRWKSVESPGKTLLLRPNKLYRVIMTQCVNEGSTLEYRDSENHDRLRIELWLENIEDLPLKSQRTNVNTRIYFRAIEKFKFCPSIRRLVKICVRCF